MKRRLLLILLTVCILLQALTFSVSAAVVSEGYKVTENTSIEDDLEHLLLEDGAFDDKRYPVNEDDAYFYIMRFLEVGYNGTTFDDDAALYVYIYNPSLMAITKNSTQNRISLQMFGDSDNGVAVTKYDLIFCDASKDSRFIKYRVDVDAEKLKTDISYARRRYRVSEIELYFSGLNADSYTVGGLYTYSGFGEDLFCSAADEFVIELDITGTYYRPDVMSSGGVNRRNELHSVYFSIPNGVLRECGALYSVQGEYYENRIASVITENQEYAMMMQLLEGTKVTELEGYNSEEGGSLAYPGLYSEFYSRDHLSYIETWCEIALNGTNPGTNRYDLFTINNPLLYVPYIFHVNNIEVDKVAVSSAQLKNKVDAWGLHTVTGAQNTDKTVYDISVEDGYKLESYASAHTDFETFLAKMASWGQQDLSTDVYIESALVPITDDLERLTTANASSFYYVAESDISALRQKYRSAQLKDETVYLLRFDQSETACYEMTIDAQESGIAVDDDDETFLYEQNYYKDFDILSLTFKDEHSGYVVVPVAASPEDNVGDITPSDDFPTPGELLEQNDDWWKVLIAIILILLLAIVLLMIFSPFFETALQDLSRRLDRWWRKFTSSVKSKFKPKKRKRRPK